MPIAERMRLAVQAAQCATGVKVTISGGLAEYSAQPLDKLIDEADQFIYLAKRNGRNQIAY